MQEEKIEFHERKKNFPIVVFFQDGKFAASVKKVPL